MPASTESRPRSSLYAGLLASGIAALVLVIAVPRFVAERAESAAHAAWQGTSPVESLARPPATRGATASALALEQAAATLGIALSPRRSGRPSAAPTQREAAVFGALHAELVDLLARGREASPSAALASWLADSRGSLDALAVDLVAAEPPGWGTSEGPSITRSPPPLERCDRIVQEAARLASIPAGQGLDEADEHLLRPGTPRLEGVTLLEEALLVSALADGRAGDMQRALRLLAACVRLEDGLAADADLLTLGVLATLGRLRLAVIRDLAPPVDAAPLLGPELESRFREALLAEARAWARSLAPPESAAAGGSDGLMARARDVLFSGPSRAMRASTLVNLQLIAGAAGPTSPSDGDLSALAARAWAEAPRWDAPQGPYIGEIIGTWSRLRRVRVEAELTRRLLAARALMLTTGDAGLACRAIADAPVEGISATFRCEADERGRLRLVVRSSAPVVGRPAIFEPAPAADLMPR